MIKKGDNIKELEPIDMHIGTVEGKTGDLVGDIVPEPEICFGTFVNNEEGFVSFLFIDYIYFSGINYRR